VNSLKVEQKNMLDIKADIRKYVVENLLFSSNGYPLEDSTSFLEEGIVDSTGVVELVLYLEENFGFSVEDSEIVPDNFDSVNNLAAYIARKLNAH
jgi:acyl carrier protein